MFVQIIQGRCSDPAGAKRLMERWESELGPGAQGWLGSTAGVTADGELFVAARFATEEDAQRNSDRPEQGAWWEEFSKTLDGPATFQNCRETAQFLADGSDDAGFVQVIQARIADRALYDEGMARSQGQSSQEIGRPDIIGGLIAFHDDGEGVTETVYFTSEEEARAGEAGNLPPEARRDMDEWQASLTDVRFIDLADPWLSSP